MQARAHLWRGVVEREDLDLALHGAGGQDGRNTGRPLDLGVPAVGGLHLTAHFGSLDVPAEHLVAFAAGEKQIGVHGRPRERPDALGVALKILQEKGEN